MVNNKKGSLGMLIPTIIMGILAFVVLIVGYQKGQHVEGLKATYQMTIQILPILVFAFIIAGFMRVLISQEMVAKWIGENSGIRGILLGTLAGAVSPGGPYVNLPIAAGLFRAGAGVGTIIAFLTGWSLMSLIRLPMEVGIIGWRLTTIRLLSVCIFPPIAGYIALFLSKIIK